MKKPPHLLRRLLRNNIFRITFLYSLIFIVASMVMLYVAYITIEKSIQNSIEEQINAEISRFIGHYRSNQLGIKTEPYAFVIEHYGRKLAGNISQIPEADLSTKNKKDLVQLPADRFVYPNSKIQTKGEIFGKTIALTGNTKLFIGKNSFAETERRKKILNVLSTTLLFLLLLGFVGGLIISFRSIKRIDRISQVSHSVIGGNLDIRVPVTKRNDDIEDLGHHINSMLNRIDELMQGMREVGNNIAHDLRTPLTHLRACIETINAKAKDDIKAESEQALLEVDHLLNTFNSLLRISQVQSGTSKIVKEAVDLSELVKEIMDFYEVLAEEKQQKVSLGLSDHAMIEGDKSLLSQAVVNLFTNAVKYTPDGGHIKISVAIAQNTVNLIIHDSGTGVPEEEIDKLTQRFYRLEKHRNTANGSGLGLAMVKAIVDAHRGNLQFINDIGLKVIMRFPMMSKANGLKTRPKKSAG